MSNLTINLTSVFISITFSYILTKKNDLFKIKGRFVFETKKFRMDYYVLS